MNLYGVAKLKLSGEDAECIRAAASIGKFADTTNQELIGTNDCKAD
jgi:hypothetical protein